MGQRAVKDLILYDLKESFRNWNTTNLELANQNNKREYFNEDWPHWRPLYI